MCVASALLVCAFLAPAPPVLGAEAAPASACQVRIVLGLVQAMPPPPDATWAQELAAANGVELRYLRRDSRLRSAQVDQRREHNAG